MVDCIPYARFSTTLLFLATLVLNPAELELNKGDLPRQQRQRATPHYHPNRTRPRSLLQRIAEMLHRRHDFGRLGGSFHSGVFGGTGRRAAELEEVHVEALGGRRVSSFRTRQLSGRGKSIETGDKPVNVNGKGVEG